MSNKRNVFIGGAWPYANGSLHVGHLAALLPGDVIARYHRLNGDNVIYVSGSDCHGTPISIRAHKENIHPSEITDKFHDEFSHCFNALNFSYDLYSRTDSEYHEKFVQDFISEIYKNGFIYESTVKQFFCSKCNSFLADRYIEGNCPHCNEVARGDQCDFCGSILDPDQLKNPVCKICGSTPELRDDTQLFFKLSAFENYMKSLLNKSDLWRFNAVNETFKYLKEGLLDRPISRDLDWGIKIPIKSYENKTLYVWFDAVLGYLSDLTKFLGNYDEAKNFLSDSKSYFVHGKDNIPFHSIIFPCLLNSANLEFYPTSIISSEYITLENKKISTSRDWAVWVPHLIENYNSDAIRYYLLSNSPEKKDGNFSWDDFLNCNNGELLGAWGNLVNRTFVFINKYFDSKIHDFEMDNVIKNTISDLFDSVSVDIENGNIRNALESIFNTIRAMNKYFDTNKPWITINTNYGLCKNTIYTCIESILNISILLSPFLPRSSNIVYESLSPNNPHWVYENVDKTTNHFHIINILFERIDIKKIQEEKDKLNLK